MYDGMQELNYLPDLSTGQYGLPFKEDLQSAAAPEGVSTPIPSGAVSATFAASSGKSCIYGCKRRHDKMCKSYSVCWLDNGGEH